MTRRAEAAADPAHDLSGWLARRGSLAVADQAVASLTGLLTHIWLARALDPAHYGLFAVSQAVYGFLLDGFGVVFGEPLLVLVPGRFADRGSSYIRAVLHLYWLVSLLASALVALAYPLLVRFGPSGLADVLLAMALAAPAMLTLQLARRICSARFQLPAALLAGLISFAALFGLLGLQQLILPLSAASAYLPLGLSAAAVSLGLLARQRLLQGPNPSRAIYREVWTEHKRWAIWGVPNVAARWFPINAYYVFMPALLPGAAGLAATAQLRVIMTLVMPMLQLQGALSGSLISTLSRRGAGSAGSAAGRVLGFVLAVSGAYALALGWAGPSIVPRIFGGHYLPSATSLWLAGLTLVASAAASVLRTTLLAAEQPRRVFIATTLSALATLSLGVWTSRAYGVIGAVLGMAAASSVQAAAMAFALRSSRHSRPPASNA